MWYSLRFLLLGFLLSVLPGSMLQSNAQSIADGWASVDSLGQNGTTGGAGGTEVMVTTTAEFLNYIARPEACIIRVNDTITLTTMVSLRSHKTIVGVGANGVIKGGGLDISGESNIIIRNLLFENSVDDAVNIQEGSHHVWIDHCDFTGAFDGLVDIKRGSDFVTVSWNHFYDHVKTCLLGHDDNNGAQDIGHLRITYHHNWFDGTTERHPRVRFSALTHVYNNFYSGNNYGIASTMDAEVLVEGNYFLNVTNPTFSGYAASGPGDLVERDNIFDNCPNPPQTRGEVPEPPYVYTQDKPAEIPVLLQNGAGRAGYVEDIAKPQWLIYDAGVLPGATSSGGDTLDLASLSQDAPGVGFVEEIIDDPDIPGNKLLKYLQPDGTRMYRHVFDESYTDSSLTMIARIKGEKNPPYARVFDLQWRIANANSRDELRIWPADSILELEQTQIEVKVGMDLYGWHTYRIAVQGNLATVYIDENPTPVISGLSTEATNDNYVKIGDGSGDAVGGYLDWYILDLSGAYAPGEGAQIPETLFIDGVTSVEHTADRRIPDTYRLHQNHPNPFNPSTNIQFQLPEQGHVTITIYNSQGQLVTTLIDDTLPGGTHRVVFDAGNRSSGIYFYKIRSGEFTQVKKMMLLK